jgi:GntR family transcriptional regulator, transcriptional repressor for pyruvate dehydrogenase complex
MGILRPGDRLPSERMLCERFGAGRSSVREALRVLSSSGLIQARVGLGSFVTDPEKAEGEHPLWNRVGEVPLDALMEVRLAIEPHLAALAAQRATGEHHAELRESVEKLEAHTRDDSLSGRLFADMAFHECLVRAADNPLHRTIYRNIEPMLFEVRRMVLKSPKSSRRVLELHREIQAAVERRDSDGAAQAMRRHMLDHVSEMDLELDASGVGLRPAGKEG